MKHTAALVGIVLACAIVATGSLYSKSHALSGSSFKAGEIITDSNFFNPNALSIEQVQQFMDSKVPSCDTNGSKSHSYYYNSTNGRVNDSRDTWVTTTRATYGQRIYTYLGSSKGSRAPYICLKNYKQDVPARNPEELLCKGIPAASNQSSAQIIDIIAKSCGVSHKVLLVLLQKEQTLVTDDWPWGIQYRSATGYGCPDTAPCDSQYYGFFNQVYHAARIYKYYAKYPDNFNHIPGETNYVRYHPNSSCGGSNVFIQNQATAGLYNYTPYQPNGSALNNLYGTGNACSAYGNRNFWRLYNDWFGSTLTEPYEIVTLVGDWDGDGDKSIGLKRGNQFYLDNNNDGKADIIFGIGKASDQAFVGDWNGDGKDTVGLKRGNMYFLDNNNDNAGDVNFSLGLETDRLIVGDWDGDNRDELGLRRGKMYFLDTNNDGDIEIEFGIGRVTDSLLIGDWDGDGKETVGLRRGNLYFLDNNNDNLGDINFGLGKKTDKALVGDWDGDNKDSIGLKRGSMYFLDNNYDNLGDINFGLGRETDKALAGDWDDDGVDEVGLKRYNRYYYDTDSDGSAEVGFLLAYY